MFVPFETLADHSRLWVYQAERKLSSSETDIISRELLTFTEQWLVHGQPMKASFKIYHDQFLLLAADEGYNTASGCSIDGSVRLLKDLGRQIGVDFLDRGHVAFKKNDEILTVPVSSLKQKSMDGFWTKDTLVFNNLINVKSDINRAWILPAGETWLRRYLSSETINL
jgi:hypothetical protein